MKTNDENRYFPKADTGGGPEAIYREKVRARAGGPSRAVAALTLLASAMASAQTINNPPLLPMDVTVFPMRDFTSIEGFAKNADVLIQVRRGDVVSDATGRTSSTGAIEVNHPGGICWRTVTPDITAGDTIRVTYQDTKNNRNLVPVPVKGSGAATNTQNVIATQAYVEGENVVIKGKAVLPGGARIPVNRLEARIIITETTDSPNVRIGKRDIRADSVGGRIDGLDGRPLAGTSGTLVYDAATGTAFTATFRGLNTDERDLVVSGQTRIMGWQQTTAAGDRLGMTIYEVGEVGGPGMGGCPAGPNGIVPSAAPNPPVSYSPANLLDAGFAGNQPSLKDVTVFPERDFLSVEGFPAGAELQVVVRRGTGATPVVGTARGIVPRGGIFEVNHPGGVCWTGQTPDIAAGDLIDVFTVQNGAFFGGQTQRVIDAKVVKPAFIATNTATNTTEVRVTGSASDDGVPLPLRLMEQRIINPDFTTTRIGRRDIRADTSGGRVENVRGGAGNLSRTGGSTSDEWRAVYTGLNDAEKQIAVAGQSRAMAWLATNANGDRFGVTISEYGEVGGPGMGGCPGPGDASIAIP